MNTVYIVSNCYGCPYCRFSKGEFYCEHPKTEILNGMDSLEAEELPTRCPLINGSIELTTQANYEKAARARTVSNEIR